MTNVLYWICVPSFLFICVVMIGLVLLQKGRGGGLASAFGGAGGNTAFGSKTGDVLTWATAIIFGVFILLAISLNLLADARNKQAIQKLTGTPAAQTETAPAAEKPTTQESAATPEKEVPPVPAVPAIPLTPASTPAK